MANSWFLISFFRLPHTAVQNTVVFCVLLIENIFRSIGSSNQLLCGYAESHWSRQALSMLIFQVKIQTVCFNKDFISVQMIH